MWQHVEHYTLYYIALTIFYNMIFSLIVPVYNVEAYLSRCLDSCIEQDINDCEYEIIVVDDGSPDKSGAISDDYAKRYSNIRVIHKQNGGLSSARNCGLLEAQGDYIWFIDSDDWIASNKLSLLARMATKYRPDAIRIGAENVDGESVEKFYQLENEKILSGRDTLLDIVLPCVPFFIWRREFLIENQYRFMEGILHEDMEFTPRVVYMCKDIAYLADTMYYVFVNCQSITRSKNPKKSFDYIEHVSNSLYNFSRGLDNPYRRKYDYLIAMCLNNAISNIDGIEGCVVNQVNDSLRANKNLLKSYWGANIFKYRLEYILFVLFSPRFVQVFRALDKLISK